MKKKLLLHFFLLFFISLVVSCNKDCSVGIVKIKNSTLRKCDVYIDDLHVGLVKGFRSEKFEVSLGHHDLKAISVNINTFSGTYDHFEASVYIPGCQTKEWSFP